MSLDELREQVCAANIALVDGRARDPLVRQRQRRRPGGRDHDHQAERRAVRDASGRTTWSRVDLESGRRGGGRGPAVVGHAHPPRPVPALRRDRRRRPHPLVAGVGMGPGGPADPLLRHDPRGPLPRAGPGDAGPAPGASSGQTYEADTGCRDHRDPRGARARPRSRCRRSWSAPMARSPGAGMRPRRSRTPSPSRRSRRWPSGRCTLDPDAPTDRRGPPGPSLRAQARAWRLLRPGGSDELTGGPATRRCRGADPGG